MFTLGDRCKAPDNSVLCIDTSPSRDNFTELSTNFSVTNKGYKQNYVNNNANNLKGRKFYFDQSSSDFTNNEKWKKAILYIINVSETKINK